MKSILLNFVLLLMAKILIGQCSYYNNVFDANEKITYEAYYNWGFIWLNAGLAEFSVLSKTHNETPVYQLKSIGQTYPNYDWLYKVRDTFISTVHPKNVSPYSYSRKTSEGGYNVDNEFIFNNSLNQIISKTFNSKTKNSIDTLDNTGCTLDILSAIYACRTINFSNKKVNDTIPIQMIVDGEIFQLHIRYLGQETIKNKDKRYFDCNKFSVLLVEGTIFKGGEDMSIWVTNDKNQIPVLIEAKILIGSVKAMVKDINGNKWPANYKVFNRSK